MVSFFDTVQEFRKWAKIKSTYIDGYLKWINPATGRIHPDLLPMGTDTGRLHPADPICRICPARALTRSVFGVRCCTEGYDIPRF